jgi:hypothetical protein
MGFKHAILVGCDYTFSPHKIGHFYRYERGSDQRCVNAYAELFEEASKCIDLLTITDNGAKSEWMKYQEYGEFAKSESKYRNNEELVRSDYLELLGKADRKQQTGL